MNDLYLLLGSGTKDQGMCSEHFVNKPKIQYKVYQGLSHCKQVPRVKMPLHLLGTYPSTVNTVGR